MQQTLLVVPERRELGEIAAVAMRVMEIATETGEAAFQRIAVDRDEARRRQHHRDRAGVLDAERLGIDEAEPSRIIRCIAGEIRARHALPFRRAGLGRPLREALAAGRGFGGENTRGTRAARYIRMRTQRARNRRRRAVGHAEHEDAAFAECRARRGFGRGGKCFENALAAARVSLAVPLEAAPAQCVRADEHRERFTILRARFEHVRERVAERCALGVGSARALVFVFERAALGRRELGWASLGEPLPGHARLRIVRDRFAPLPRRFVALTERAQRIGERETRRHEARIDRDRTRECIARRFGVAACRQKIAEIVLHVRRARIECRRARETRERRGVVAGGRLRGAERVEDQRIVGLRRGRAPQRVERFDVTATRAVERAGKAQRFIVIGIRDANAFDDRRGLVDAPAAEQRSRAQQIARTLIVEALHALAALRERHAVVCERRLVRVARFGGEHPAQRIEPAAVRGGARGVRAQRLAHLRRARGAHAALGFVETQARGIERKAAEIEQRARLAFGIGERAARTIVRARDPENARSRIGTGDRSRARFRRDRRDRSCRRGVRRRTAA